VQLREKDLPPDALERLGRETAARCRAHGARLMINGDIRLAARLDAGVHLPSAQLMDLDARPELEWVAASCHDEEELARAAELELDFVVLGPAAPTASHPDAQPLGWDRLAALLADYPLPVFALGGLSGADLPRARALGCHGIALKSGAWKETP
jgi:8-oxo-dGTP diphosphatase